MTPYCHKTNELGKFRVKQLEKLKTEMTDKVESLKQENEKIKIEMSGEVESLKSENEKLITLKYRKFRNIRISISVLLLISNKKNLIRKVTLSCIKNIKGILVI